MVDLPKPLNRGRASDPVIPALESSAWDAQPIQGAFAGPCDCSTKLMISSFSDAGYLSLVRYHPRSCFLSRRLSSVRSATHSLSAQASRRRSLTSSPLACFYSALLAWIPTGVDRVSQRQSLDAAEPLSDSIIADLGTVEIRDYVLPGPNGRIAMSVDD